jgi:hypothetical protein
VKDASKLGPTLAVGQLDSVEGGYCGSDEATGLFVACVGGDGLERGGAEPEGTVKV